MNDFKTIEELIGKTITKLEHSAEEVVLETSDGSRWRMWHEQDCCEGVRLEVVDGQSEDLIGKPVTIAREEYADEPPCPQDPKYPPESATYTNFTIGTEVGQMAFKWIGESNGYYSESVYFEKLP